MSERILIVDDSALARRRAKVILEGGGYEVIEAQDGIAAIERYFLDRPSLVMLDLVMKGMYGMDVLAQLRQMDPKARVIVVSADVQTSSHEMAEAGGAVGFLVKPLDEGEALALVRKTLGHDDAAT
jgi:two-component system chemotaxis response regulator CheY